MLDLDLPGYGPLRLKYLLLDLNGTLTHEGVLLPRVKDFISQLKAILEIIIISANTFGKAGEIGSELGVTVHYLENELNEKTQKGDFVNHLGAGSVVAIGNGMNDQDMLKKAKLGIVVIGPEGAAIPTLVNATIVVKEITDAFEMLLKPRILRATLRW